MAAMVSPEEMSSFVFPQIYTISKLCARLQQRIKQWCCFWCIQRMWTVDYCIDDLQTVPWTKRNSLQANWGKSRTSISASECIVWVLLQSSTCTILCLWFLQPPLPLEMVQKIIIFPDCNKCQCGLAKDILFKFYFLQWFAFLVSDYLLWKHSAAWWNVDNTPAVCWYDRTVHTRSIIYGTWNYWK